MRSCRVNANAALCMVVMLVGCQGEIDSRGSEAESGGLDEGVSSNDPHFHFPTNEQSIEAGVRRLTRQEYAATIAAQFSVDVDVERLPNDPRLAGLRNDAQRLAISDPNQLRVFFELATEIAAAADAQSLPCENDCEEQRLRDYLSRLFVKDPSSIDIEKYLSIYESGKNEKDAAFARRAVLQSALQSPHFLYRVETSPTGDLRSYARIEKLAYFLWGSPPDDELFNLAADGSINSPDVFSAQIERMTKHKNASKKFVVFARQWLAVDDVDWKAKQGAEELPADLLSKMEREFELLVRDVFDNDRGIKDLLTSDYTFADAALRDHYGLSGEGDGFAKTQLDGSDRRGLLTTGLIFAAHSKESGRSPMVRGKFLVDSLLCTAFPIEAGIAAMELSVGSEGESLRDRFAELETQQPCSSCHRVLNAGFSLDIFDTFGRRFDTTIVPLTDTRGFLDLPPYGREEFDSAGDAIEMLSKHPAVGRCVMAQLYRDAQGRLPGQQDKDMLASFDEKAKGDLPSFRNMMVQIASSPEFLRSAQEKR